MNDKVLTLLGFAAKSGNLCYGANNSVFAVKNKKAYLVLWANDISPKTQKEICYFAEHYKVPTFPLTRWDTPSLSNAVGKKCGVLAVTERQFAESVLQAAKSGGNANE